MQKKDAEYKLAISLRKEGNTYREILEKIPVAKSTLSSWLKSVGLAKPQMQRLTKKRLEAGRRGGISRRIAREQEVRRLIGSGIHDVGRLSERELWLIGITLYWGEGSKQHAHNPSVGVIFSNSDAAMHRCFLKWLSLIQISERAITFELFVHESRKKHISLFKKWWMRELNLPDSRLETVYLKAGSVKTNRHNVADLYHGLLRIKVAESTSLNRKIQGWIEGIAGHAK